MKYYLVCLSLFLLACSEPIICPPDAVVIVDCYDLETNSYYPCKIGE